MRLRVDFSDLYRCVEQMGAQDVDFTVDVSAPPIEPIDLALREGLKITLDDINYEGGLLSYEGRQILLYIKDHGRWINKALEDGSQGKRFHVADCRTLQEMRAKNRFERYFVTNDLSGRFEVTGFDPYTRAPRSGEAELRVCINCLKKLNYKGYALGGGNSKKTVWEPFRIDEFFQHYSSCFKYLPHHSDDDDAQYTEDWPLISGHVKAERRFVCEQCGVRLGENKNLLHVHHANGHKSDNREANLKALCADCHRKQDSHEHLFVSHEQMRLITKLRREQRVLEKYGWEKAIELADPAVEGVVLMCKSRGIPIPEVGYELQDARGRVVAEVELAWPDRRVAVVLSSEDQVAVEYLGWSAWQMIEVLDKPQLFAALWEY